MLHTMKRCIALLLALSMCFSLLSTGAWAADTSGDADISGDVSIVNNEGDGSTSEEASAPEEAPKEAPDESGPEESKEEPQEAPKLTDERKEKVDKSVKESKEAEEAPKEGEEQSEETPAPKALKGAKGSLRTQGWGYEVSYIYYDASQMQHTKTIMSADFHVVTTTTTAWSGGWYVVTTNTNISDRITVNGKVNLILCDGAKLTASKGITVTTGNTLNIYPGTTDDGEIQGTGELSATGSANCAGIGGSADDSSSKNGGTVNIHGGKITATGGDLAAGIGGADGGNGGNVTIYGGVVTATGGTGAEGIGHGGSDSGDSGSLNVDNGLKVFGGTGSASMEVIEETDNDYHREQYMEVFAPVASVTSGSTTSYYSVFNDIDGGSTNDAVHAWLKTDGAQLKLLDDVTTDDPIAVSAANMTLDLNGFGIRMTGSDRVITVNSGATLNLYDCDETEHSYSTATDLAEVDATFNNAHPTFKGGYITGGNATNGGGVVVNGGTFTMSGGNIVGNTAGNGGGVYVDHGTFTMSGGEITGNKANNDFGNGGGVNNNFGTFTMQGGKITGNTAANGGGVNNKNGGTFTMEGGSITKNTAGKNGGGVYVSSGTFNISGAPVIKDNTKGTGSSAPKNNVYLYDGQTITVNGALTGDASIGVTMGSIGGTGVFTTGENGIKPSNYASKFFSDNKELILKLDLMNTN